MASVRLTQLVAKTGTGSAVRLVSLVAKTFSSGTNKVRLTSLVARATSLSPVTVSVGPDRTVEPLEWVQITATASEFVVWSIRQDFGPVQTLLGEAPTWTYRAPGTLTGTAVGFTVTGTSEATGDPEKAALLNTLASSATSPVKVAFLGSSTTAGNNATTVANRYVNLLSAQLRTRYGSAGSTLALDGSAAPTTNGLHTRNGGAGGTTAANYVPSTRHAFIATLQPQICFHMIGSNDYGFSVDPAVYKTNIQTVIDAIDAEVTGPVMHILVGAYQRMDVTGSYPHAQYGQKMAEIAAENSNVIFLDLNPFYIAVGIPGADPLNYIDTDNLHQTNAGHAFMASNLFDLVTAAPAGTGGGGVGSDSVVHTILAHGGFWSPGVGSSIRARGITRYADIIPLV